MTAQEIIIKKRDGHEISTAEIGFLVEQYVNGQVPDYQMSAFLMAVYLKGMNFRETTDLTITMRDSGAVVDLSHVPGMKVDKHSTGGVGDKISLILAPLAVTMGLVVPMISGRGLGHTGGTLDKLESIPGYNVHYSLDQFKKVIAKIKLSLIGQTDEIAPADRLLYALRDVTGTIESIPLISASIMSKKLAEGIDALVLDVKVGNGAFMRERADAVELAKYLIAIAKQMGKKSVAVLTAMDQPLGRCVGNWLEMREAIEVLNGKGPADIRELSCVLAAYMAQFAEPGMTIEKLFERARNHLSNGDALAIFECLVKEHGGDIEVVLHPDRYPLSDHQVDILSPAAGYISEIKTFDVGMTGVLIGAGRLRKEDDIDYTAGIEVFAKLGDHVDKGQVLATIHTNKKHAIDEATRRLESCFSVSQTKVEPGSLILGTVVDAAFQPFDAVLN